MRAASPRHVPGCRRQRGPSVRTSAEKFAISRELTEPEEVEVFRRIDAVQGGRPEVGHRGQAGDSSAQGGYVYIDRDGAHQMAVDARLTPTGSARAPERSLATRPLLGCAWYCAASRRDHWQRRSAAGQEAVDVRAAGGLFLPAGVALCVVWLTGLWMFWLPFSVKRRRARTARDAAARLS